jgi:hypothetical protein
MGLKGSKNRLLEGEKQAFGEEFLYLNKMGNKTP